MAAISAVGNYQVITSDYIEVTVTTDITKNNSLLVKKFQKDLTIWDLKQRLELMTGRNANTMTVTAFSPEGELLCKISENDRMLGSYPFNSGIHLLVEDPMYVQVDEDDEDLDKRFQLSEEQYASRKGTLKEFLSLNKIGKYNPDIARKKEELARLEKEECNRMEEKKNEIIKIMEIGQRCEVKIPATAAKRGVILFKGTVKFAEGFWVGVKYDEPFGQCDGSVNGVKYFTTLPNYGAFVNPIYVEVGDFPELTDGLEGDDEF